MIVCRCTSVTEGDVASALDAGARTLADVCRRTGAAQECGGCIFGVRKAVCDHLLTGVPERRRTA